MTLLWFAVPGLEDPPPHEEEHQNRNIMLHNQWIGE
jgi:hypothetical protein